MASESEYPRYTVSSLTAGIKHSLEGGFSRIILDGEISGWKRYPSGHCYFTVKDGGAQISAVMFSSAYERCKDRDGLQDGAKVSLFGSVTVYPPRGNYQMSVLSAKIAGVGDLMRKYVELKARLEKEGLFDSARKRPLPFMPRRIGIVTSEAGAVIHDMCTVLLRRFPNLEIRLFPCQVQGAAAPESIVRGIEYFNGGSGEWNPDILIVARGGGSFEDLFCFNDESLVRAVAASRVPVVSAVGHETDYTLCDFAADVRAGTPSIAAETAVPVMADLASRVSSLAAEMSAAMRAKGEYFAQRLDHLSDGLASSLALALSDAERRLERVAPALASAVAMRFQEAESRVARLADKLHLLSPYGVLERGYSLTTALDGSVVRDAATLKSGDRISTRFASGIAASVVCGANGAEVP